MTKLIAIIVMALGACSAAACTPAQIAAVKADQAPKTVTSFTIPADRTMRWECRTPEGHVFYVNDAGHRDLGPGAHCKAIPPTSL